MTTRTEFIQLARRLSTDGIHGPTIKEYKAAAAADATLPRFHHIIAEFSSWAGYLAAANLTSKPLSQGLDLTDDLIAEIHAKLRELSPDGIHGPTLYAYNKARGSLPASATLRDHLSNWKEIVTAAGLTPAPTRKANQSKPTPLKQIDQELFDLMGWTPDTPHSLRKLAHLPSSGLITLPKQVKPVWDWRTMSYRQCEVYELR